MQLKWLVIVVFVGVQTLTAGIVAVTTWAVVTNSVATNTAQTTRAVADTVRLRYERFVDPATDAVDLARFILQRHGPVDLSLDTFERFMFDQLTSHPVVDALYLGRSSGEFMMLKRVQAPGEPSFLTKHIRIEQGTRTVEFRLRDRRFDLIRSWRDDDDPFDPRTRPWYRVAREQAEGDGRRWTEPYTFFTSGAPGVSTANALVGTSQDSWGAVSVDIETGSFSEFLSSLSLPKGGGAFIAGWNGEVVALPSEVDEAARALFADTDGSGRPALLLALIDADPDALETTRDGRVLRDVIVGGQPHIVQLVGFAEAGMPWSIVVSVPEETVFGWVYRLRDRIIWVSVAASVVATLVLLLFWRRSIERPMAAISSRLAIIGAGGYSGDPPVRGVKEMRRIDAAVIAAGRLINERQSARLELIARLRDLVEAMEQAPVGIAILEADRRLGFANRAARIALSVDEGEDESIDAAVLGMTEAEFAAKAELVLNGRTVRGEAALPGPAGVTSQYGVVLSPLSDGGSVRLLLVLEDVSTANDLEAGLIEAREAAERSDQAKTLFLAQMSHEFRTPLNAIAGFSEMLLTSPDLGEARTRQYVGHISESAATLLAMVERILEYVRYESGGVGRMPRPTDVGEALEAAIVAVAPEAEAAGVTMDLTLHGPLEPVAADPALLTRAFEQILSNGIKFSTGGGRVSVAAAVSQSKGVRRVTVGVVDRGSGINLTDLPRVFEPFWKAATHLRTSSQGPGLGLAIARRILTGFGGRIEVDSAPGEGTRVVASLPVFGGPGADRSNDN
ncbi:HAMP domain-containing sensor histidine kinase [Thalassobaculum sp. OXR-137]|uniref:sensor histidine kinase n=1 Tax=Thalassobaculum sp. OXR-137 TaxID=3100173 RepID=UPI002AC8CE7E|nr:HAMP domain-containing sensor histidine kinase [Thalassobaculum sp. OXR-137]WPZ33678.1 HAMP domain-containing sensor histidine kinase [Thalassobaculum sp. OXR-137]